MMTEVSTYTYAYDDADNLTTKTEPVFVPTSQSRKE